MPVSYSVFPRILEDGQTVVRLIGDPASRRRGAARHYDVLTAGRYSGTRNLDYPQQSGNTYSFSAATKRINDAWSNMFAFQPGDKIRVLGSASNDGVYTVSTLTLDYIQVVEALVDEPAGAYIHLLKRAPQSNGCVYDHNTGLMWLAAPLAGIGVASDGKVSRHDAFNDFTVHPAGADLQMVAGGTLRIMGGAGEASRYYPGMLLACTGFANSANNLPGLVVASVVAAGGNLDIGVLAYDVELESESAAGSRAINVMNDCCFAAASMANVAALAAYVDWRLPEAGELATLIVRGDTSPHVDTGAFPSVAAEKFMLASSFPDYGGQPMLVDFSNGTIAAGSTGRVLLVRG